MTRTFEQLLRELFRLAGPFVFDDEPPSFHLALEEADEIKRDFFDTLRGHGRHRPAVAQADGCAQ
jgi:hypothetical protein